MAKMALTIEVVEITRKGEHIGYKLYINDLVHAAKLPRKPGDLNRQAQMRFLQSSKEPDIGEHDIILPGIPIDYYTGTMIEAVQQALIDWQIWKEQGYKRTEA